MKRIGLLCLRTDMQVFRTQSKTTSNMFNLFKLWTLQLMKDKILITMTKMLRLCSLQSAPRDKSCFGIKRIALKQLDK